jgi:hypothetical protein
MALTISGARQIVNHRNVLVKSLEASSFRKTPRFFDKILDMEKCLGWTF